MPCIDSKIRYINISEQKRKRKIRHGNYYLIKRFVGDKNIDSNQLLNYKRTRDAFPTSKLCKKGSLKIFDRWTKSHLSKFLSDVMVILLIKKISAVFLKKLCLVT